MTGGLTWRDRRVLVDGQVEQVNGAFAARANARGTLLLAGGTVYARNQTGGSYALVRTGKVGGIPITRENQDVGVTDHRGRLLVQNLPAQATVKIDVKADKLPADALVRETTKYIRVPRRAVAVVDIETLRFRPVIRKLVDTAGQPLAVGLPVRALPSDERTIVGFDGLAEINAGSEDRRLLVGHPGALCVVELAGVVLEGAGDAPLACRPYTIAQGERAAAEVLAASEGGQRRKRPRRTPKRAADAVALSSP